jgi:hypothetical protein
MACVRAAQNLFWTKITLLSLEGSQMIFTTNTPDKKTISFEREEAMKQPMKQRKVSNQSCSHRQTLLPCLGSYTSFPHQEALGGTRLQSNEQTAKKVRLTPSLN